MAKPFCLLFIALFGVTTCVQAQAGLQCFSCYSRVCGANISELTSLLEGTMGCCECFNGTEDCNIADTAASSSQMYGSRPLGECCNNVSHTVRTESYKRIQSTGSGTANCDDEEDLGGLCFHSQQELAIDDRLVLEMSAGAYIVHRFQFDRSNSCISSLSIRAFNGADTDGITFTLYKTYMSRSNTATTRLYEEKMSFRVQIKSIAGNVLTVIPMQQGSPVCVEAGDTLGFSVLDTADFRLGRSSMARSDDSVGNITDSIDHSCEELNGLFEPFNVTVIRNYDPLIAVNFGPLSTTAPTTPPDPSSATTMPTTDTEPPTPMTTQNSETPAPPTVQTLSIEVIVAIGAGGGVSVLLLLICVVVTCLCWCRRQNRTTFDVNEKTRVDTIDFRLNNSSASHRMQELSSNKITVENPEADDINPYDVPEEQPHFYHEVQQERIGANGVQAGRLATTGQQMPMIFQGDPGVYSDPTELGSTPPISSHIAHNPLYRAGPEACSGSNLAYNPPSHYDVPTALIRAQGQATPPPFYHELEGPTRSPQTGSSTNIYTETAFGLQDEMQSHDSVFGSNHSLRSSSVETNLTRDTSIARESMTSDTPLIPHFYHVLESNSSRQSRHTRSRSPLVNQITLQKQDPAEFSDSLERSTGGHRVFEPGIHVPGGEERLQVAVIKDTSDISEEYRSWRQKSHKASKQKRQFFEETLTFWEPKNEEVDIYNQLSEMKFREILRDQIVFSKHLGVGQFGSVSKATWSNQQGGSKKVAVKTLKPTMKKDARIVFLKEAAIMGQFCHSNVVQLYGVVTVGEPIMIVMELMALGDLDTYLYNNYRPGEMPPPHKKTLLSFSRQVACGMKYLERKKFVHRDLAARNVLVNETLVCKIGDFGMSRILLDSNYYASRGGTVPIKWTAPEGLNYKKFSTASDVYSYGMVLYEIWSLGLKPLAHIKIQNVSQFVTEGHCQPPPPGCPRKIYEIMVHCWAPEQQDRPTFSEIFELLNGSDTELLSWSEDDMAEISNLAMQLGAPLSEAKNMFPDLQNRNLIREETPEHTAFLSTAV